MRITQIDGLRGFALFGILIVNIFVFHAPYPHYSEFYLPFEGIEHHIIENMIFFFGGKFMFIYAFLFGYSFWIQYEKQPDKKRFKLYWNKRMLWLAIFGALHVLLLNFGDILLPYALLGFSLPLFVNQSNRKTLIWALLIYLIPVFEFVIRPYIEYPSIFMEAVLPLDEYIKVYSSGNVYEMFKLRMKDYFSFSNEKVIIYITKEIALFLLGMVAAKENLATTLNKRKALIFCFLALALIAANYFFRGEILGIFNFQENLFHRIIVGLFIQLSEFMHGMVYIIAFFLLWENNFFKRIFAGFKYTGRLSLSNYIGQTIICVFIFSYLGFYGQLSPSTLILIALPIYLFQILFSYFWLQSKKYGPLEALWRKLSSVKQNKD